jgi:ribosome maturation factor RimP
MACFSLARTSFIASCYFISCRVYFFVLLLLEVGERPLFLFRVKMAMSDENQRHSLEASITELAEQLASSIQMEVVLVESKGDGNRSVVRVFIDKLEGVSLEDCERFSKRFSVLLDVENLIPFSYTLEVSSPGVNRPLVKESDFRRFCGKEAKIRIRQPLEGQRNFKGKIVGVTEGRLELEVIPGKQVGIALIDIEKANLIADLRKRPQGS